MSLARNRRQEVDGLERGIGKLSSFQGGVFFFCFFSFVLRAWLLFFLFFLATSPNQEGSNRKPETAKLRKQQGSRRKRTNRVNGGRNGRAAD